MILTLMNGRRNVEECDIEVPDHMTAGMFKERWIREFAGRDGAGGPQAYLLEGKETGGGWFPIPDEIAIRDSGLQDGSFVRIKNIYSTVQVPAQEEASVPLFQSRND
ncbi:hypothetical protein [Paenibacillus caui]|uniref:hypothetical protein n=1 Tax=Paenibacillus caui TaxID=2873927 RepID=UPI001CA9292F|nr:hypothetical protein [Paenibacillus caui]